jgi:hypothetical protein
MKPASLLRWYPRAWRDRYGGEPAALIQDTLDEGRPAWRLRLSVIGGACANGAAARGTRQRRPSRARPGQLNASGAYWVGVLVTGLAIAAAIGLWAAAVTATARHLTLAPRVRAAHWLALDEPRGPTAAWVPL